MKFSVALVLATALPSMCVAAAAKPAKVSLPIEARAQMVKGAKSLVLRRLPIGEKGAPALVHLWMARRGSADVLGEPSGNTLYCIDIFSPGEKLKHWQMMTSATFLGELSYAPTISTHWLRPDRKEGLVVEVDMPDSLGTTITLATFPEGLGYGDQVTPSYTQTFYARHSGGGVSSWIEWRKDKSGALIIVETVQPHVQHAPIVTTFRWDGTRFAKTRTPFVATSRTS